MTFFGKFQYHLVFIYKFFFYRGPEKLFIPKYCKGDKNLNHNWGLPQVSNCNAHFKLLLNKLI